jgi:hypothetical protein
MQQTMLALGALLILVTLSLNQQRSVFIVQRSAYIREMESAAADFARMRLHEITEKDFDENRVGMTSLNTGTTDLTPFASFGIEAGENPAADSTFDDIDDYHAFTDTTDHVLNNETFRLISTYSVQYVNPGDGTISMTGPTLAKEFTVDVSTLDSVGAARARVIFQKVIAISDYID